MIGKGIIYLLFIGQIFCVDEIHAPSRGQTNNRGDAILGTRVKTNSGTNSVMASRRDYNSAARWRKTGFEKTLYLQISMRALHIPTFFFIFGNIIQFAVCGIQE